METNSTIVLDSGWEVYLNRIEQYHTYEGLLEGYPCKEINESVLERCIHDAKNKRDDKHVQLIPPEERTKEHKFNASSLKPWIEFPDITCIAKFNSRRPVKGDDMSYSTLTIVWFQPTFVFPIEEKVLQQIKSLDWGNLAEDVDYI